MEKTSNTQSSGSSETDRAHENEANQAIQKIRKKLLDLGGRNVLLNYRHPKGSSLRIIDELPDQIANELNAGKKFDFVAVPEPKERELIGEEKADELIEFVEKIHRMLNAYIRSIGRAKDESYSKPSYNKNREENRTENREESNGNIVETVSEVEPDGNSFTASADEFFSSDELTNA